MTASPAPHGLLLVDKAPGSSSHRCVAQARRVLGTRAVGHAGTLDPMASGLLVLGVGQGTKLLGHLALDDKRYDATLRLGIATDSLDADGEVVEVCEVPTLDPVSLQRAAASLVGRQSQVPPVISAIKRDGVPLYRRARRGEAVTPEPRDVILHGLHVELLDAETVAMRLHCGKGFYVRSLGRDLAAALGTVGHLTALRRTESGRFDLRAAIPGAELGAAAQADVAARDLLSGALISMEAAAAHLPRVRLDEAGSAAAFHGRPVERAHNLEDHWPIDGSDPVAVFGADARLLALGRVQGDCVRVTRGFRYG